MFPILMKFDEGFLERVSLCETTDGAPQAYTILSKNRKMLMEIPPIKVLLDNYYFPSYVSKVHFLLSD